VLDSVALASIKRRILNFGSFRPNMVGCEPKKSKIVTVSRVTDR